MFEGWRMPRALCRGGSRLPLLLRTGHKILEDATARGPSLEVCATIIRALIRVIGTQGRGICRNIL
jgi:hypothetical protein